MSPTQLLKERASGMYQLSAFYFARLASDIPLDMAIPTVFVILLYFIGGLRVDSAKYFFQNWFAVILVCPTDFKALAACSIILFRKIFTSKCMQCM